MWKKNRYPRLLGALVATSLLFVLTLVISIPSSSQPIDGAISTKSQAVARGLRSAGVTNIGDTVDAKVIDVRLLHHKDAHEALGIGMDYNLLAKLPKELRPASLYAPDSPVWVVTVAGGVSDIPMFTQGPEQYAGAIFIYNAVDGEFSAMGSFSDSENDMTLQKLRQLPDLSGKLEIQPVTATPNVNIVQEPTATPVVSVAPSGVEQNRPEEAREPDHTIYLPIIMP